VRTGMNYGMGLVPEAPVELALRHDCADSGLNFERCNVCEF
jgi:hypothetical protein